MNDITPQILAAIPFADAIAITVAAGLALIGLSFLGFVLSQGANAARGHIGTTDTPSTDYDDDDDERYRD